MEYFHLSVLLKECIEGLGITPDGIYIDATAGAGGHSLEIAKRLTGGRLLSIDKDMAAIKAASQRLLDYPQAEVVQGDFSDIRLIAEQASINKADGILLDLGVSSHQLDTPERGFSYWGDTPLDMRMSGEGQTAADILRDYQLDELTRIFRDYGEEKFAYRIATNIVLARDETPIETSAQLVEIIKRSIPAAARREGGHPAKRVFQALRITVNSELESLKTGLVEAFELLNVNGRLAIITFHSLEDRIVKHLYHGYAKGCTCPPDFPICICGKQPRAKFVNKKPITATAEELEENNRSRSAKLRILEKIKD